MNLILKFMKLMNITRIELLCSLITCTLLWLPRIISQWGEGRIRPLAWCLGIMLTSLIFCIAYKGILFLFKHVERLSRKVLKPLGLFLLILLLSQGFSSDANAWAQYGQNAGPTIRKAAAWLGVAYFADKCVDIIDEGIDGLFKTTRTTVKVIYRSPATKPNPLGLGCSSECLTIFFPI